MAGADGGVAALGRGRCRGNIAGHVGCRSYFRTSTREWLGDAEESSYLAECPTLNFAFRRTAFEAIGGFDESFAYGSDVDFTWRLNDAGYRVRHIPDAVLRHDWGASRRQRRRSFMYGKARARLYEKHVARRKDILRNDPMVVIYPLFLVGLPLTLIFPLYPLLLLIPAWRNRADGLSRCLSTTCGTGPGYWRNWLDDEDLAQSHGDSSSQGAWGRER